MTKERDAQPDWLVFVCYRRDDGRFVANMLYELLHGRPLPIPSPAEGVSNILDVFLDVEQPATADYLKEHQGHLEAARAFIYIASAGAALKREPVDHVARELEGWLSTRDLAPIIIDPYGAGDRYVPDSIKSRFPNANRIEVPFDGWATQPHERQERREQVQRRLLESLALQAGASADDLSDRMKRSRQELALAVAAAEAARAEAERARQVAEDRRVEAERNRALAEASREQEIHARRLAEQARTVAETEVGRAKAQEQSAQEGWQTATAAARRADRFRNYALLLVGSALLGAGVSVWRSMEAKAAERALYAATVTLAEAQVRLGAKNLELLVQAEGLRLTALKADIAERYAVSCDALVLTTEERAILALDTSAELDRSLRAAKSEAERRGARVAALQGSLAQQQSDLDRARTEKELEAARAEELRSELDVMRQERDVLSARLLTAQVAATDVLREKQECTDELATLQTRVGDLLRVSTAPPTTTEDPVAPTNPVAPYPSPHPAEAPSSAGG